MKLRKCLIVVLAALRMKNKSNYIFKQDKVRLHLKRSDHKTQEEILSQLTV